MKAAGLSPVRGDAVPELELQIDPGLAARANNVSQLRSIDAKALEAFADQYVSDVVQGRRIVDGERYSPVTMLQIDLRPGNSRVDQSDEQLATSLKRRVAGAGLELAKIWSDGIVHEREILPLQKVLTAIDTILEMKEDRRLDMVGRNFKPQIDAAFAELAALAEAARGQLDKIKGELKERDFAALEQRLADPTPTYESAGAAELGKAGLGLVDVRRYAPGDLIVVDRYPGKAKLGIVVGHEDGKLRVELAENGNVSTRLMSARDVVQHNPLKIGDFFDLGGRQIWIRPSKTDGVVAEERDGLQIKSVDVEALANELRAEVAKSRLDEPHELAQGVRRLPAKIANAAVVSEKGPLSPFNDDATLLETVPKKGGGEVIVAGVADEARRGIPGFASTQATGALLEAAKLFAKGDGNLEPALRRAVDEADQLCRGQGYTTLTGAVLEKAKDGGLDGKIVHVGDSVAWKFSARGRLQYSTPEQNVGRRLAEMTGDPNANPGASHRLSRAIGENAAGKAVVEDIHLDRGEFLVFLTHGGSQANLEAQKRAHEGGGAQFSAFHSDVTAMHVGSILEKCKNSEEATKSIREYILAQMNDGSGRPENNISVIVVQA